LKAWTDYPIIELGDTPYVRAPIREVEILYYDGDKYCRVLVDGVEKEIKAGYLYRGPGRCDEAPYPEPVTRIQLHKIRKGNP